MADKEIYIDTGTEKKLIDINNIPINPEFYSEISEYDNLTIDNINCSFTVKLPNNVIKLAKMLSAPREKLIMACSNKRVVYLAIHGKKARTRKKNINRIYREVLNGR